MGEPQPFTDDELAQARNAPLGWTARRWLATVDALRAALAARPEPDPRDVVVSEAQAVMRIVYEGYREDIDFRPLADALEAVAGSATPTHEEGD